MNVVLIHPEIPWNTGNIGRTCVAAKCSLHLVKPLGFSIDHKWVKRAGLDYWKSLDVTVHDSLRSFLETELASQPIFLFSRFAKKSFWKAKIPKNAVLIFGSETSGLPANIKTKYRKALYRIPTKGPVRSLNLSTAVGIVLFEALRQQQTGNSSSSEVSSPSDFPVKMHLRA